MKFFLLVVALFCASCSVQAEINICEGIVDNLFLPVLGNCSAYYVCMNEMPIVRVCKPGTLFDAKTQTCTFPESAQCIKNCTAALSSFCYDRTCTKYVLCYAGTPVIRECCDGLQYNAETDRCDFPQFVDCVDDMCTIFNNPQNITFIGSKAACDKYYVCMNGLTYARNCSKGLQFNPECDCCDFASRVNCSVSENMKLCIWVSITIYFFYRFLLYNVILSLYPELLLRLPILNVPQRVYISLPIKMRINIISA